MEFHKQMTRYLMDRFGLLRFCGKHGNTKITIYFNNDTNKGLMEITSEDPEFLLSSGVKELRGMFGEALRDQPSDQSSGFFSCYCVALLSFGVA